MDRDQSRTDRWIEWAILGLGLGLAGIPAISVPAGMSAAGLPIGLQFLGPHFAEPLLLRAAQAVELAVSVPRVAPGS